MTRLSSIILALLISPLASLANAAPITAEYVLDINDCVVFDTGAAPFVFADDCTGSLTVTTDTDISFGTPDAGQTGHAVIRISSPTYGTASDLFFNFIKDVLFDANGVEVPICLDYCFYSNYDAVDGLSFAWFANRGLPYSNGQLNASSSFFDYESNFNQAPGVSFGLIANGTIKIATVPLPASAFLLALGVFGLNRLRKSER